MNERMVAGMDGMEGQVGFWILGVEGAAGLESLAEDTGKWI